MLHSDTTAQHRSNCWNHSRGLGEGPQRGANLSSRLSQRIGLAALLSLEHQSLSFPCGTSEGQARSACFPSCVAMMTQESLPWWCTTGPTGNPYCAECMFSNHRTKIFRRINENLEPPTPVQPRALHKGPSEKVSVRLA